MFTYEEIFSKKQNILFVTAHPDDILVYFAALVHKLRKDSKNVFVVTVTNGARGSKDTQIEEKELAQKRVSEEIAAMKFLTVPEENCICLNYKDGEVESNFQFIGEISKYIRKFKADLVATHEPSQIYQPTYAKDGFFIQHRDHRKVGEAAIDAVYPFSRDRSFFTEHYSEGIEQHSVYDILLTDERDSNFSLDYTDHLEQKKNAMRFHKSQFNEDTITEINEAFKLDGKYQERFNYLKLLW